MQLKKMIAVLGLFLGLFSATVVAQDAVNRAQFTSAVEQREPADELSGVLTPVPEKLYFFTDLRGMSGHKITHRWEHAGQVEAEISFHVGGDRWRVWSSKNLIPELAGEWQVTVLDDAGQVLKVVSLEVR